MSKIRDGQHAACGQNCVKNGSIFNHEPYKCPFKAHGIIKQFSTRIKRSTDIRKLIQYKKIQVSSLPLQEWSVSDQKDRTVADFDFKSDLTKERERELKLGLRTDEDVRELVTSLEQV